MALSVQTVGYLIFMFIALSGENTDARCERSGSIFASQRCYWAVSNDHNFRESHKLCQSEGGILAEIPDSGAQEAVNREWINTLRMYWIGIHDMYLEESFVNMLNESITYKHWGDDQPNNKNGLNNNADCVLDMVNFGWLDTVCSYEYPAICSKRVWPLAQTTTESTTNMVGAQTTSSTESSAQTTSSTESSAQTTSSTESSAQKTFTTESSDLTTSTTESSAQTTSTTESSAQTTSATESSAPITSSLTESSDLTTSTTESSTQTTSSTETSAQTTSFTTESNAQITSSLKESSAQTTSSLKESSAQTTSSTESSAQTTSTTGSSDLTTSTTESSAQTTSLTSLNVHTTPTTKSSIQTTLPTTSDVHTVTTARSWKITTSKRQGCLCPCSIMKNTVIIKDETQLRMKIEAMKKTLVVNKTLLSSSLRRKISAPDSRTSATVIGSTLGVAIIVLIIALVIASDAHHLYSYFKNGMCKCGFEIEKKDSVC